MMQEKRSLSRREFLQRLAVGTAGAVFAVYAGNRIWVSALIPDDPEDDPRNIVTAKEAPGPKFAESQSDTPTALSDGTRVDKKLYPDWPDKNIAIRQTKDGKFIAWTLGTNPVWVWGGEEADDLPQNGIRWGQPEIAAYSDDPTAAIKYTNMAESTAGYSMTKTVGDALLAQSIPSGITTGLWQQRDRGALIKNGLLIETDQPSETELSLPEFSTTFSGITIECWLKVTGSTEVFSSQDFTLSHDAEAQRFLLQWGTQSVNSPLVEPAISDWHHVAIIVDANPGIINWVIDGQSGWERFPTELLTSDESIVLQLPQSPNVEIGTVRIYGRALRIAECISSYQFYGQGMGIYDYI
jgi:hypothetical protein